MNDLRKGAVALVLLALGFCSAQTRREDEPYCERSSKSKVEIADGDATILGFKIGTSTLTEVQAKLGRAKLTRVSRDEESDSSICYISPADGTVLVFYTGVMGAGEEVTWFALWSRQADFQHSSQCTSSNVISKNVGTASGIRLGLSKADFEKIAGKSRSPASNPVKYDYLCRRKMTENEIKGFKSTNNWDASGDPYFDRTSWIKAWYGNATISRVEVGEFESY